MEEKILSIASKKTDAADLLSGKTVHEKYYFKDNEADKIEKVYSNWYGLRVINEGRLGISYTSKAEIDPAELVDRAVQNAKFGPIANFDLPAITQVEREVKRFDPGVEALTPDKVKDFSEREINTISKTNKEVLTSTFFGRNTNFYSFANSNGVQYDVEETSAAFMIETKISRENDLISVESYQDSRKFPDNLFETTDEVKRFLEYSFEIKKIKTQKYNIYLHPYVFAEIIDSVITGLNGKVVEQGGSKLTDKLGKQIFSEKFTLTEKPFIDYTLGSGIFDSEGVPRQEKSLIDRGTVNQFFYDLRTAGKAGTKSTGNGFRSVNSQAQPVLTNAVITEGAKTEKEIIKSINEGIYVYSTLGGFTNDPLSGDFSVQCRNAYYVKDGEIVGRLKNAMIFFNIFEILNTNIVDFSKERRWVEGKYIPGALFEGISTTA